MKKILQIVDVKGWAIDKLASAVCQHNEHLKIDRVFIHPRGLERGEYNTQELKEKILQYDIIDAQYWRTLSQLAEAIPELKEKIVMLTHHNEKNLLSENWDYVDVHIAKTIYSQEKLEQAYPQSRTELIYNSYPHDEFEYNENYPPQKPCVGYVGRIVPWKGLKEILRACTELGYTLLIMGKQDKINYWNEIPEEDKECIDWSFFDCKDEDRKDFYKNITCYVGNSGSGREVGPLGLIEAMACGVPVITTPNGIARDICEDEDNALVVDFDDYDELKEEIQNLMESPSLQNRLRRNGWDTIRNFNDERMALAYRNVFNSLIYGEDVVSVVIPATSDRVDEVNKIILSLESQTYKSVEAVVVWDEESNHPIIESDNINVKNCSTGREGYNLAMARNIGAIESDGKYIMFCDSRMEPQPDAIYTFLKHYQDYKKDTDKKYWLFGDKGSNKHHFVENFSFISREDYMLAGMSNERIDEYGGMSQELRTRFLSQGFSLTYVPQARARELRSASKSSTRRNSIIKMKNKLHKIGL